MKIKSIKKIDYKEDVYNLHIKDNHNYFASNHCVSNCHDFDDVMSDFISIKITEATIKKLKFTKRNHFIDLRKKALLGFYKKSTQQDVGCREALFKLGEYYQKGIEVERNI